MLIDSQGRDLYVFGGKRYDATGAAEYSGLYSYSLVHRRWQKHFDDMKGPQGQAEVEVPSRIGHSMLLEPNSRKLIVLAGQRVQSYLSDLWTFNLTTKKVECLTRDYTAQGGPDGGFTQRAVLDPRRKEFVLLSGLMRDRAPPHYANVKVRPSI